MRIPECCNESWTLNFWNPQKMFAKTKMVRPTVQIWAWVLETFACFLLGYIDMSASFCVNG